MAVRQFDGVDDDIRHAVGSALADMAYGTFAALIKAQAPTGDYGSILSLSTSGNVLRVQWYYDENVEWHNIFVPNRSTRVPLTGYANQWALLVARKASGNVPVTFSLYRFNQGQWTHASSSNFANWTSPGANGIVARSLDGDEHFRGLIAVQAVWANRVPFANNTAVQNAGLHQSLQAWFDAEPDALWVFNQESVNDPVDDLTGNGADQIARTGTAVVTDDDPPGFDWGDEEEVPELTATLAVELNLAGDAATPPATIPEVSSALDVAVDFAGAAETPPAEVPELAGALDLEVDLGGILDTPSATVPELAGSIDLEVDLGGILDTPTASIPEVSATLGVEIDLGGILDLPSAAVPQVAGSLDLEIGLSGELSRPTALVPTTSAELALILDLGGRLRHPIPPVEFFEGTGRATVAIDSGRAKVAVGPGEATVAIGPGRAEAKVTSGRSKARTP